MPADILTRIQNEIHAFSKGQKKIASYILTNYDKAAFMTASRLGKTVEVSESTVVRFAVELGYAGYPEMQKTLQELVRNKLTSVQRIEVASDQFGNQDVVSSVLQRDANAIRMTAEALDRAQMIRAVGAILRARCIYIVGVRSSAALANYLNFYFRNILKRAPCFLHGHQRNVRAASARGTRRRRHRHQPAALFQPDSEAAAVRTRLRRDRRDHHGQAGGPAGKVADYVLCAKSNMVSFVDSLVAPMSVVNALIVSVGLQQEDSVAKTYEDLERIWDEYDAFERVE